MRYKNNYQKYTIDNQHEYFLRWNSDLKGPKYRTPGKILFEAQKDLEKLPVGEGTAVAVEPDNLDSLCLIFVKTGQNSMKWTGTVK